jgi:hypothetical protein
MKIRPRADADLLATCSEDRVENSLAVIAIGHVEHSRLPWVSSRRISG